MALPPKSQQVWDMCEAYVPIALEHLSGFPTPLKNRETERTFDTGPESFRIHFLFPSLPEKAKAMFMQLRQLRWHYGICKKSDEQTGKQDPALCPEQLEAEFEQAKARIAQLLPSFSTVQKEIIREKFITLEGHSDS